ncbi:hypothetical protein EMCRGX_G029875 [Ephydatia muelleri]|eukprot:Em0010g122a
MEAKLTCRDLLTYLQELPAAVLSNLYQHSAACLAVYRELPELSRQYIMRVLFLEHALPLTMVSTWARTNPESQSAHQKALSTLQNLRVSEVVPLAAGQQGMSLSPVFKINLKVLICGGGTPWVVPGHVGEDKHTRDMEFLESYAEKQWEAILNFLVGVKNAASEVSQEIVQVLQHAGLVSSSDESQCPTISNLGFQFLLMDRSTQVWYFILQYLAMIQARGLDLVPCLHCIFQLSFMVLGKDYSTEGMTPSQFEFMQNLRQFGLVYQRKRSSKRYYPTKLAINLVAGGRGNEDSSGKPGYIILETNYRVVAYTDSQLQIATLALFCQLQYRFPNMVVGIITRESIHQALMNGLTAEQILSFLRIHAHPQMKKNKPLIPPTVSDQIRLWEKERDRLEFGEGVLYSDFYSARDFETVETYAKDLGVLLWSNTAKRLMVVTSGGHDEVRRFWRRQKSS